MKHRLSIDKVAYRLAAARCAASIGGLTWRDVASAWNGMEYQMCVGRWRWARYSKVRG